MRCTSPLPRGRTCGSCRRVPATWRLTAACNTALAPEDCSTALLVWFDAGLLGLLRRWPEEEPVPVEQAPELLRSPDQWVQRPDGSMNVAVVATTEGDAVPGDNWVHALYVLRPAQGPNE